MNKKSIQLYQEAQIFSLSDEHEKAIEIIDKLLKIEKPDVELLRFKGNTLDYKAISGLNSGKLTKKEADSIRIEALSCYEKALKKSNNYVPVIIDVGDYWEYQNNEEKALSYYNAAIDLLKNGIFGESLQEEIDDVFSRKSQLLKEMGNIEASIKCSKEHSQLVNNQ